MTESNKESTSNVKEKAIAHAPIIIALITAISGLLGTGLGVMIQGINHTNLERQKFEANLILKALEPSDPEGRADYLKFLVDAGLVKNLDEAKIRNLAEKPEQLPRSSQSSREININYERLEKVLIEQKFQEADEETRKIMYELSGLEGGYLDIRAMNQISCADIKQIDQLWSQASEGKFGFSVQREIWKENPSVDSFGSRVGWKQGSGEWITIDELTYDTSAPRGSLPSRSPGTSDKVLSGGWLVWYLLPTSSSSIWVSP